MPVVIPHYLILIKNKIIHGRRNGVRDDEIRNEHLEMKILDSINDMSKIAMHGYTQDRRKAGRILSTCRSLGNSSVSE